MQPQPESQGTEANAQLVAASQDVYFQLVALTVTASQHASSCVGLTACPIGFETVLDDTAHKPVIGAAC